jgi:hypothetical protein
MIVVVVRSENNDLETYFGEDIDSHKFELLTATCRDWRHYARREDVRLAIKTATSRLNIYVRPGYREEYISTDVTVSVSSNGSLSLGCHTFDPEMSKKIIRWANARRKK